VAAIQLAERFDLDIEAQQQAAVHEVDELPSSGRGISRLGEVDPPGADTPSPARRLASAYRVL